MPVEVPRIVERLRPWRTLPARAADLAGTRAARFGESHSLDWLVYNPMTMWSYHRLAQRDAGPVIEAIGRVFPGAASYVDVGAGSGAFAAAARRRGARVVALERSRPGRLIAAAQRVTAEPFDLRRDPPATRARADLAYCFEVAEHLPPDLGERLAAFLSQLAPVVVFTAAQPGQGGYGHINEQPKAYWHTRFRWAGMEPWEDATRDLARTFGQTGVEAHWFFDNLIVFRARSDLVSAEPAESR
jgi:SAM-dependent methyltransferase